MEMGLIIQSKVLESKSRLRTSILSRVLWPARMRVCCEFHDNGSIYSRDIAQTRLIIKCNETKVEVSPIKYTSLSCNDAFIVTLVKMGEFIHKLLCGQG